MEKLVVHVIDDPVIKLPIDIAGNKDMSDREIIP
jgi:hypothetical protein